MRIRRRARGQALIPVVFAVLILTALAISFSDSARREIRAAQNFCAETQKEMAAEGALQRTMAALADTSSNGAAFGTLPTDLSTDANGWTPIGDEWVKIEAVDTASRIDLNNASGSTFKMLPALREHPDVAAAIVDWRSKGEQPSVGGAKSEVYRNLPTPYAAKDAPFDTVDELLLVRGMTPATLFGLPNSFGGGAGSAAQFDDIFGTSKLALSELLSTYVRERNVSADGQARVNINKATEQDLQRKLGLTVGQAQAILTYRNGQAGAISINLQSATLNNGVLSVTTAPSSGSNSPTPTPDATTVDLAIAGKGFKSAGDLLEVDGLNRRTMARIADRVAVNDDPYRYNVVNVNTAAPEVLATVPGMDRQTLRAILSARAGGRPFRTLGDLFQIQSIQRSKFEAVVGHLTTKSSAYIVRIRVRSADSPTLYAASALIELTDGGPRVLQWRPVSGSPGTRTWAPMPSSMGKL